MAIRLASPLYLVREDCERDLAAVLHRLAQIGFDGVEFLGFFGHSAQQVRAMLDWEGLEALGNHVPFGELSARPQEVPPAGGVPVSDGLGAAFRGVWRGEQQVG